MNILVKLCDEAVTDRSEYSNIQENGDKKASVEIFYELHVSAILERRTICCGTSKKKVSATTVTY